MLKPLLILAVSVFLYVLSFFCPTDAVMFTRIASFVIALIVNITGYCMLAKGVSKAPYNPTLILALSNIVLLAHFWTFFQNHPSFSL
jgi:hypothetical protein